MYSSTVFIETRCRGGLLPKFDQFFLVHKYISGKIFMKIWSVFTCRYYQTDTRTNRAGLSNVHSVHVLIRPSHIGGPAIRQRWKLSCQSLLLSQILRWKKEKMWRPCQNSALCRDRLNRPCVLTDKRNLTGGVDNELGCDVNSAQ